MRTVALLIGWVVVSLLGAGTASAVPQVPANQENSGEVEKSNGMKQEEKNRVNTIAADEDRELSVTLPAGAKSLAARFLLDQKQIWTSPAQVQWQDANWLMPLSGAAAGMFVTDADMSRHISRNPTTVSHYNTLSNAGVATLIGGSAAMWLLSYPKHNEHWRETGFLAGEAALNSLVVIEAIKYPLGRERPYQGDGSGPFFKGSVSFPSEHSAAAWAVAGVMAHEYPGPLTKIIAYSLASLVDYSRYRARQHFPSDVFIGSIIGNLVAQDVYNRHHDTELGGAAWESWGKHARDMFEQPSRANMGSPYVPLDSWVYPAIERLMGLDLIDSGFLAHRPWTRAECARLIAEASDHVDESNGEASRLYAALQGEFRNELGPPTGGLDTTLESVYSRATGISGKPLGRAGESYDFGQTIINDYGRPYAEGVNAIEGFSFYTAAGPWVGYVRGEYQYAPSAPSLTLSERTLIPTLSGLQNEGVLPAAAFPAANQFQLIEAYAGVQFANWMVSFGPQTTWSGPTEGGPMLLSTNSQPIPMIRIARASPATVPLLSKILGPAWFEIFLGQLSGQYFLRSFTNSFTVSRILGNYAAPLRNQPYLHAERLSWKPTRNFEFGLTRTVMFGGGDIPMTLGYFKNSLFGFYHDMPGTPSDPGKQASALDWNYRLPLLRNWVSFYGDAFTYDQYSPIAYWDRSAISAGMYFSHLPRLPKLDFRVEGVYTDLPAGGAVGHGFWYSGIAYASGYTNDGNLIGSWIGRDAQGAQAWTNYWFTPKNRIQCNFRHEKISQQFIAGGGSLTDVGVLADYWIRPNLGLSASAQYERWLIPAIQANESRNVAVSLGILFQPQKLLKRSSPAESHAGKEGDSGF